jgi:hypothetical protein
MTPRRSTSSLATAIGLAALALAACDRGTPSGADTAPATPSTARADPPAASPSMPVPVSGQTNPSTAGKGDDLSNSTRASGNSNVYQPPSSDNPPPGGTPTAGANSPASAASQSVSSQTRGTSPPPNSGTLPGGTEGNTGSRRGGGKG